MTLSQTYIDFGFVPNGGSATVPVTLSNTGTGILTVSYLDAMTDYYSPAFFASSTCQTGLIPPSGSCTIFAIFTPGAGNPPVVDGAVIIRSNAAPSEVQIGVHGVSGTPPTTIPTITPTLTPTPCTGCPPAPTPTATPLPTATPTPPLGRWALAGSMHDARDAHTATLLPDGKVLVAGGNAGNPSCTQGCYLNSAELYDPHGDAWTPTGGMRDLRDNHTATLLPNGTVLVAGGYAYYCLASAEVYTATSGAWTPTGSMTTPRDQHTATLLPNGTVLVAGGCSGAPCASAEIYNPTTGSWTPTGSMNVARSAQTATLLPDGRVLVAGGPVSQAELYDAATGAWTLTGSMNAARAEQTATLLPNGKILVAGGCCDGAGNPLASAELYDPTTGSWTPTGGMNVARDGHTATLLSSGQVFVTGGGHTQSAEMYMPARGVWTLTASMSSLRADHTATLLADGRVLVVGGMNGDGTYLTSAEAFSLLPPTLRLQPWQGAAHSSFRVLGQRFARREALQIYWNSLSTPPLTQTLTTEQGSFVARITVPSARIGRHWVLARGQRERDIAVAIFAVVSRQEVIGVAMRMW